MKDHVKIKVPNGTFGTLIPSDGVVNCDGVLIFNEMLKGDYATNFWSWMERAIKQSSSWKYS